MTSSSPPTCSATFCRTSAPNWSVAWGSATAAILERNTRSSNLRTAPRPSMPGRTRSTRWQPYSRQDDGGVAGRAGDRRQYREGRGRCGGTGRGEYLRSRRQRLHHGRCPERRRIRAIGACNEVNQMLQIHATQRLDQIEIGLRMAAERHGGSVLAVSHVGHLLRPEQGLEGADAMVFTLCFSSLYAPLLRSDIRFAAFLPSRIAVCAKPAPSFSKPF